MGVLKPVRTGYILYILHITSTCSPPLPKKKKICFHLFHLILRRRRPPLSVSPRFPPSEIGSKGDSSTLHFFESSTILRREIEMVDLTSHRDLTSYRHANDVGLSSTLSFIVITIADVGPPPNLRCHRHCRRYSPSLSLNL